MEDEDTEELFIVRFKVTKLSHDKRAYSLLGELNTRPSVKYLKKIEKDKAKA